ncbi:Uncharacterised protein [Mycobacteroides abscessus subsp. abscessus]|nr:Uncharacterised protein [Mycobacteroides abscessus subsp. abscessus]
MPDWNVHAVRPALRTFSTRSPLETTVYSDSVRTVIRNVALFEGWSLHGNHVEAPMGCPATRTPSSSSSQPMSPQVPIAGCGLPV